MASAMGERFLMGEIIPPIFIVEDLDVGVYASIHDVERHLEPIDIRNQEYVAYDAVGKLLRLGINGNRVTVLPAEHKPSHASKLKKTLCDFLKAIKKPVTDDQRRKLSLLVEASKEFVVH